MLLKSIDLKNKKVVIESPVSSSYITNTNTNIDRNSVAMNKESSDTLLLSKVNKEAQLDYLAYDYLVIAIGSETKFFGMTDIEKHALTIKSWNDAIIIRNHVIHQLEQAELLLRRQQQQRRPPDENDTNNSPKPNQENERQSLLSYGCTLVKLKRGQLVFLATYLTPYLTLYYIT
jgi:hypothetical protein